MATPRKATVTKVTGSKATVSNYGQTRSAQAKAAKVTRKASRAKKKVK